MPEVPGPTKYSHLVAVYSHFGDLLDERDTSYHLAVMKRDSRGRFAKELKPEREKDRSLLYQRNWRAKKNLCTQCAKRPKAPGLSRCGECVFGEDNPEALDLVPVLSPEPGKPSRIRAYRKMMKAKISK